MGLLERIFGKEKRHKIEDSGTLLLALVKKRGLSDKNRDPALAWAAFKEYCLGYHFQCDDDAVLWEIGPYGRLPDGRRTFQWHLVRQLIEGSGEDEDISQVHLDLTFSEEVGEGRKAAVWSYDVEGDFNAFFTAVEARPDFPLPRGATLLTASVGLEKV